MFSRLAVTSALVCLAIAAAAQDIIIDNEDGGFSQTLGSWTVSGSLIGYPGGTGTYLWTSGAGSSSAPTARCQWQPTITTAGPYQVSVWYVQGTNRPTDAPYTVVHAGGSTTIDVNQEINGSQWVPLGVFSFNAGTGGRVELANDAESGQAVIADAVRFSPSSASPEIRGVWTSRYQWPGGNQSATESNIDDTMDDLVTGNFNTVFFQIRGQCDTLYPSPNETWSPIFGESDPGYDPVAYAVSAAHSRGLSFHAYINTHTIWGSSSPPSNGNHVYYDHGNPSDPAHRDWLLFDDMGGIASTSEYHYMNPGIPEADTWVREQVMHVIDTYDVDGVHWDRARMSEEGFGRNPIAVARWDDTGTGTPNDGQGNPENLDWDDFMRDSITRCLINITGEAWAADPSVVVSSAPLGLWRYDAYGYPTGYYYGYVRGQDAKAWMQMGAMDFIVPQIYWADGGNTPDWTPVFNDWLAAANATGRAVVPASKNGVYSDYPALDASQRQVEVENHATTARSSGAAGHNLWHANDTNYSTWSSAGHPYESATSLPTFPWRSTEGVIVGRVYETDGVTPITDAWVTRTGETWTALSSADGFYAFLRVPPGTHTITAQHPSHPTAQASGVSVTAGAATVVDLVAGIVPAELTALHQE
ncbi:family 10 glycosylhydrolase [Candidatus Sumerlaeota bacterium]|nr:family 10 glycosylhydrolase [Candidatus Sumerlaeota bacterium]